MVQLPLSLFTPLVMTALRTWRAVRVRNGCLPFRYILESLPFVASPIFVEAASSHGIGCFYVTGWVVSTDYFSFTHDELRHLIQRCPRWEAYPVYQSRG